MGDFLHDVIKECSLKCLKCLSLGSTSVSFGGASTGWPGRELWMWDSDDVELKRGDVVGKRWVVREKLGQGSFGAVYEARDKSYQIKGVKALKLESVKAWDQLLKVEIAVLKLVEAKRASKHVCTLFACGSTDKYNFMLMTLLGPSLQTIRKNSPGEKFSMNTTIMVGVQSLRAIKDLHLAGWLHRDIKPSNFAVGIEPKDKRTIFIFDFGLARLFLYKKHAKMRKPRKSAEMRGTLRYCSLNSHREKELGRHDDLISLQYMLEEMATGSLPWKKISDPGQVAECKIAQTNMLFDLFDPSLRQTHLELMNLTYEKAPDYNAFRKAMDETVSSSTRENLLFDWEIQTSGSTIELTSKSNNAKPAHNTAFVPAAYSPAQSMSNPSTCDST